VIARHRHDLDRFGIGTAERLDGPREFFAGVAGDKQIAHDLKPHIAGSA
jgi:hypothetical protein